MILVHVSLAQTQKLIVILVGAKHLPSVYSPIIYIVYSVFLITLDSVLSWHIHGLTYCATGPTLSIILLDTLVNHHLNISIMKLSLPLQKAGFFTVLAAIFLLPLFFLPITSEFYEFNKQALLATVALTSLTLWSISLVADKQVRITRSPFGLPFLTLAAAWLLSTFLKTPNRVDAFLDPGSTTTILSLVILFFTSINLIRTRKELDSVTMALISSVTLLAVISIIWGVGIGEKIAPFPFLKTPLWTPTGNPISTLSLLLGLVPFLVISIVKSKESSPRTLLLAVSLFLCVISSAIISYRMFRPNPNSPISAIFLPQRFSWAVALESLKISPLLGTGPSTYLADFTRFRPVTYNLTPIWNIRFAAASNYYLHLLTTVGLIGLLAYLFLALRSTSLLLKTFSSSAETPLHSACLGALTSVVLLFISQVFLPGTITILTFVVILMIIASVSLKLAGSSLVHEATIDIVAATDSGTRSPLLPYITLVLALSLAIPSFYLGGRAYYAETLFQQAVVAAAANDGKKTYDTLIATIAANPFRDTYRLAYAQTNLLLAGVLSTKKDITDSDRQVITQLIQQAIREAKNAVALNPAKVANVENLATTYRNLINLAQGSDAWTVASYQQAIALDPTNPNLRIALGGTLYALKNYSEAARFFQSAVDLKPNLPNAYYNLGATYREQGDYPKALAALQNVSNLVDRGSADYTKVQTELDDLRKKLGEAAAQAPAAAPAKTELESPQPLPSPKLTPPLKLPAELGPESSPSPTPIP